MPRRKASLRSALNATDCRLLRNKRHDGKTPTRQSSGRDASKKAERQILRDAVSANAEELEGDVDQEEDEEDADYETEKNSKSINTICKYFKKVRL
jgi:hypothetical protein